MSQYIAHPSNLCGCGCKGSGACGPKSGMGHDGLSGWNPWDLFPTGIPTWQRLLFLGAIGFAVFKAVQQRRADVRSRRYVDGYVQVTEDGKKRWKHRSDL